MEGIIKSVTPQLIGGAHKSWTNKYNGNLNYGFNILFEDGTSGTCGSEKTIYPLPVGTEVTYELAKTSNGSNNITKVKKVEPIGQVGVTGNGNIKSNYYDPSVVKRIAFSMCQTISRMFFTYAGRKPRDLEDINGLAGIFYNWVLGGIVQDDPHFRDQVSRRYYSLQLAVECMVFPNLGIASKEQVMDAAEVFLGPLMIFTDEPPF